MRENGREVALQPKTSFILMPIGIPWPHDSPQSPRNTHQLLPQRREAHPRREPTSTVDQLCTVMVVTMSPVVASYSSSLSWFGSGITSRNEALHWPRNGHGGHHELHHQGQDRKVCWVSAPRAALIRNYKF